MGSLLLLCIAHAATYSTTSSLLLDVVIIVTYIARVVTAPVVRGRARPGCPGWTTSGRSISLPGSWRRPRPRHAATRRSCTRSGPPSRVSPARPGSHAPVHGRRTPTKQLEAMTLSRWLASTDSARRPARCAAPSTSTPPSHRSCCGTALWVSVEWTPTGDQVHRPRRRRRRGRQRAARERVPARPAGARRSTPAASRRRRDRRRRLRPGRPVRCGHASSSGADEAAPHAAVGSGSTSRSKLTGELGGYLRLVDSPPLDDLRARPTRGGTTHEPASSTQRSACPHHRGPRPVLRVARVRPVARGLQRTPGGPPASGGSAAPCSPPPRPSRGSRCSTSTSVRSATGHG